ncbi:MAG: hypothetical protein A2X49_17145 [Lentisphaerae bacterium GWF2_52_8]|nr:MAG: hypothetical protein A2X49_17145 [Lentisphaerae bacterium GWF2_52_8]
MFIPYKIEDDFEQERTPFLVYTFCAVYLLTHLVIAWCLPDPEARESIYYRFGAVPMEFRWWSPLSCTFLHADWLHLAGNLYFFWIYGKSCEKLLGHLRFLLLYLFGAFVSVWAHVLTVPGFMADEPAIGASGAISAVLGAFLVLFPRVRIKFIVFSVAFSRPLPAHGPAYFVLGAWFIVQLAYGLQIAGDSTSVAFWAHIAGFGAGAAVAGIYLWLHRVSEKLTQRASIASWSEAWRELFQKGLPPSSIPKPEEEDISKAPDHWRMLSVVLGDTAKGISHESLGLLLAELAHARDGREPGRALQCYDWLLRRYELSMIPPWVHQDGAIAALRMKKFGLAISGFQRSLASCNEDNVPKAIAGLVAALEKSGEKSRADGLQALLSSAAGKY